MNSKIYFMVLLSFVVAAIRGNPAEQCPLIQSRSTWQALPRRDGHLLETPVEYAIIAHTASRPCFTFESCTDQILRIQQFHINGKRWDDIAYNFLIGGDGQIYEGVGFLWRGTHSGSAYNSRSIAIAFIGNFTHDEPNNAQLNALQEFLTCAVNIRILQQRYKLVGHRQVISTQSPGDKLYDIITKRPHWYNPAKA